MVGEVDDVYNIVCGKLPIEYDLVRRPGRALSKLPIIEFDGLRVVCIAYIRLQPKLFYLPYIGGQGVLRLFCGYRDGGNVIFPNRDGSKDFVYLLYQQLQRIAKPRYGVAVVRGN